jgi:hypothetical protein
MLFTLGTTTDRLLARRRRKAAMEVTEAARAPDAGKVPGRG